MFTQGVLGKSLKSLISLVSLFHQRAPFDGSECSETDLDEIKMKFCVIDRFYGSQESSLSRLVALKYKRDKIAGFSLPFTNHASVLLKKSDSNSSYLNRPNFVRNP